MDSIYTAFQDFLLNRRDTMLTELAERVRQHSPAYARSEQEELSATIGATIESLAEAIGTQDMLPFIAHAEALGEMRALLGFELTDVLVAINSFRTLIWEALEMFARERPDCTIADAHFIENMIEQFKRAMVTSFNATYTQIHYQLRDQVAQIVAQQQTIRELSTPILPLYEGILVLPLIGAIDSRRANQIMERLLTVIAEHQSDIVIIDITGVPVIDTAVASYLLQTARAAQLIGAQVILVGIGPEIAQTIVQLGVDLSRIAIGANLQSGIELAFRQIGKQIIRR
ncbi:MAG: STAS domain-containing protein [Chloroflexus sp.]